MAYEEQTGTGFTDKDGCRWECQHLLACDCQKEYNENLLAMKERVHKQRAIETIKKQKYF